MKTIAFYSYKGGTGKTLMAANLAVCLSRIGKTCVLVDCDVEGPSSHNKFHKIGSLAIGRGGGDEAGGGGFVGLIAESLKGTDWERSAIDKLRPKKVENVQPFIYPLPSPLPRRGKAASGITPGAIHLLPAGNIYSDDYWRFVWSPLWRDLFTIYDRQAKGTIQRATFERLLDYLLSVKDALANLTPPPEYMLVDLRAGASEFATTLINAWVDTLVYCFSFNEDNIQYLRDTFFKLEDAGVARERDNTQFKPTLVLSRVPSGIDYYRGDRELRSELDAMRIKWDEIHILHSDRDLELQEELRLGFMADPQNRRLTNEYLGLFEDLLEPERTPGWLKGMIGLVGDASEETDRVFNWEPEVGALINPNDGSRNVSFKVFTFQLLLQGIATWIQRLPATASPSGVTGDGAAKTALESLLYTAGLQCGEMFGESLASKWKAQRISVEDKITKWCQFDSDVGFGKFELDPVTIETRGQRLKHCDIVLRESCLTSARDFPKISDSDDDHPYCEFMTGYIQGVLQRILVDDIQTAHQPLPGGQERQGARSRSCLFTVNPMASSSERHQEAT